MSKSEIELVISEVVEWQDCVAWHDKHGWESPEQERDSLTILIDAREKLAHLQGSQEVDSELRQLGDRLGELEAEIAEQETDGERWAETVAITLRPVGPDIIDRAARYFGSPQGYNGVQAYCRHQLTNYDSLLKAADRFPGRPQDILKERAYAVVTAALKRVGVDEDSFCEMGEDVS